MNNIIIRQAKTSDAGSLVKIYGPYVQNTAISFEYVIPTVEEFERRIEITLKNYPYIVAELDGEIVGYAYASIFHGREAYKHSVETSIYVADSMKQEGIGSALYAELERRLISQNVFVAYACVTYTDREDDDNLTAGSVTFHEKLGYTCCGRHEKCAYKFNKWYSVMWLEKWLADRPEKPADFIPWSEVD